MRPGALEAWFWKVQFLGRVSYLFHYHQPKTQLLLLTYAIAGREFSFINSNGRAQYAGYDGLRGLYDKCPGLLAEFDARKDKHEEAVQELYLQKLNEYLALHPEVDPGR